MISMAGLVASFSTGKLFFLYAHADADNWDIARRRLHFEYSVWSFCPERVSRQGVRYLVYIPINLRPDQFNLQNV